MAADFSLAVGVCGGEEEFCFGVVEDALFRLGKDPPGRRLVIRFQISRYLDVFSYFMALAGVTDPQSALLASSAR